MKQRTATCNNQCSVPGSSRDQYKSPFCRRYPLSMGYQIHSIAQDSKKVKKSENMDMSWIPYTRKATWTSTELSTLLSSVSASNSHACSFSISENTHRQHTLAGHTVRRQGKIRIFATNSICNNEKMNVTLVFAKLE
jgi:hypothetical protein